MFCVCFCVCGWKTQKTPKLSPMADDASTWGGIRGLESPLYICAPTPFFIRVCIGIACKQGYPQQIVVLLEQGLTFKKGLMLLHPGVVHLKKVLYFACIFPPWSKWKGLGETLFFKTPIWVRGHGSDYFLMTVDFNNSLCLASTNKDG